MEPDRRLLRGEREPLARPRRRQAGQRRPAAGRDQPFDRARGAGGDEIRHAEPDPVVLLDPAQQRHRQQRMAAEGEEVVVGRQVATQHAGHQTADGTVRGPAGRRCRAGQGGPVQLAGRGPGQRRQHGDVLRHRRRRQLRGQPGDQLAGLGPVADDVRAQAVLGARPRQHRGVAHLRLPAQRRLGLPRRDPHAPHLDQVVLAGGEQQQVTPRPDQVAGGQPAAGGVELPAGAGPQVAELDVGAGQHQLAGAVRAGRAQLVRGPGQRAAQRHRGRPGREPVRGHVVDEAGDGGLGQPVRRQQDRVVAGDGLPAGGGRRRHRLAADHDQPQPLRRSAPGGRQPVQPERPEADRDVDHCRAAPVDQLGEAGRRHPRPPRQADHGRAGRRGRQHLLLPDVEARHRALQHGVPGTEPEAVDDAAAVDVHRGPADHAHLRLPGRAGGRGQVRPLRGRRAVRLRPGPRQARPGAGQRRRAGPPQWARGRRRPVGHQEVGPGVGEQPAQPGRRRLRVQGEERHARGQAAEHGGDEVGTRRQRDRDDPAAVRDRGPHHPGDAGRPVPQLVGAEPDPAVHHRERPRQPVPPRHQRRDGAGRPRVPVRGRARPRVPARGRNGPVGGHAGLPTSADAGSCARSRRRSTLPAAVSGNPSTGSSWVGTM